MLQLASLLLLLLLLRVSVSVTACCCPRAFPLPRHAHPTAGPCLTLCVSSVSERHLVALTPSLPPHPRTPESRI